MVVGEVLGDGTFEVSGEVAKGVVIAFEAVEETEKEDPLRHCVVCSSV